MSADILELSRFITTIVLTYLGAAAGGTFSSQTGGKVGSQFEKDGAVGGVRFLLFLSYPIPGSLN